MKFRLNIKKKKIMMNRTYALTLGDDQIVVIVYGNTTAHRYIPD